MPLPRPATVGNMIGRSGTSAKKSTQSRVSLPSEGFSRRICFAFAAIVPKIELRAVLPMPLIGLLTLRDPALAAWM